MNNEVKACFTEQAVLACARTYNLGLTDLTFLGSWQNYVYGYTKNQKEYIMRLTHHSHRSQQLLQDELDFILYLANNGVSVSIPLLSPNGLYVECLNHDDSIFYTTTFERAFGKPWIFNESSIYRIGEITGQIHALSKQYKKDIRYNWFDNGYLKEHAFCIPPKYEKVIKNAEILVRDIYTLPKNNDIYGLIHGDINGNNYLVDNSGEITLFDFDECQMDWYVDDIVIQLFYYTYVFEDVYERANFFLKNFLGGYRKFNQISNEAIEMIPLLLKMRELIVFTGACRGLDMDNLDEYTLRFINRLSLMDNPLYIDVNKLNF